MNKPSKIRKSLKASFLDGIFSSCMQGLTTDYITPFALALKATTNQIGFLSAIPSLASSLVQLKTPDVAEKLRSRKKIINFFVLLQVLTGIPIILVPFLFKSHQVIIFIILVTLFTSFSAFTGPAWASLMSEYIPYNKRGRYFGWRNKILGIVVVSSALLAGFILYSFRADPLKGFLIIFVLAVMCRFVSWYFLTQMHEPLFSVREGSYFTLVDFVKRLKQSNFAKFVFFVASLIFCVNIASPFFAVFMLRDLKFGYLTYTVVVATVTVVNIFMIDRWGKHADKVGNLKVIKFCALFIASLPLWWLFNQHPVYLVLIQIISGFAWSGFNLCAINFIYDAVTPEKRTRCIAYFNFFIGLATCFGALLGGFLANHLPNLLGFKLFSLFAISSFLRFCVAFVFSGKIKEVRSVEKITSKNLFYSVVGINPIPGIRQDSRQLLQEE